MVQALPKQTAPYVMLRQHMLSGNQDALREAVLLELGYTWDEIVALKDAGVLP